MIAQLKKVIVFPIALVAIICAVFLIDTLLPIDLSRLGIRPRSLVGLVGVPISPFLHGDFNHLFSNIPPLLVLAILVRTYGQRFFILCTLLLILLSGTLTWLLSSADIVIGASGLVFAYWAYLVTTGIRLRTIQTIALAVITLVFYGGIIFGLASFQAQISWAGHFSGAVTGVALAFLMPPPTNR